MSSQTNYLVASIVEIYAAFVEENDINFCNLLFHTTDLPLDLRRVSPLFLQMTVTNIIGITVYLNLPTGFFYYM